MSKEFSKGHFIFVGNMLMPREMSPKHLKSMTGFNKNVLIDNFCQNEVLIMDSYYLK